jgi:membrane-associated phospholipid phosphatase
MRGAPRVSLSLLVLGSLATTIRPAHADTEGSQPAAVYDVSLPIDGAVIAVSAAGILVPYALSSRLIHPTCPCSPSSVNSFDRGVIGNASDTADLISNVTVGIAILAPPIADWLALGTSRTFLDDLVVFTESLTVNGALVTAAKYAVQRPIPRAYTDPALAADPGSYRSFYSGHTSLAFAALATTSVTLNARYGLTWQPWVATVVIGASVGIERILAGYHFYTDVLVGAAAGAAVGVVVPLVHLRSRHFRLSALRPADGAGLGLEIASAF